MVRAMSSTKVLTAVTVVDGKDSPAFSPSMNSWPKPFTPSTTGVRPLAAIAAPENVERTPSCEITDPRCSPVGSSDDNSLKGSAHPLNVVNLPGTASFGAVRNHVSPVPVRRPNSNGATFREITTVRGTGNP